MSEIPDGADNLVAVRAVAWEIAKKVANIWVDEAGKPSSTEYERFVTNTYIRIYRAILNEKPLPE